MEVTINGQPQALPSTSVTLAELLVARELANKRVAVERNGEIVPKSLHATTQLCAGDRLEIVVAVGGG